MPTSRIALHRGADPAVCPWVVRRRLNALLAPNQHANFHYTVTPRSNRAIESMAVLHVHGIDQWLIHRKVFAPNQVDPPDPKWWMDPATGTKYVVRHDDAFFCDDCPPDKRGLAAPLQKAYCPPGHRAFSNL